MFSSVHLLFIICILILIFSIYIFNFRIVDGKKIVDDTRKLERNLYTNDELLSLVNGSTINNISNINIKSTNPNVTVANDCSKGLKRIGDYGTDDDCVRFCLNSEAKTVQVNDNDETYFYNKLLTPGVYCQLGPRPQCNTKTTVAIITLNSVVCRSKFPKIFSGKLGNRIIACNNKNIYDPQNILWDYKIDELVNPLTTTMTNEDELLPNGEYRFRCKFNGMDGNKNLYQENPLDRFHPIRNWCSQYIFAAHPNVKLRFEKDATFTCDCGDYNVTRVRNIDNDPKKPCSDKITSLTKTGDRYKLKIPYNCFTLYSAAEDIGRLPPCPPSLFVKEGSKMEYTDINFGSEYFLIEHPYADKFIYPKEASQLYEIMTNKQIN